jgi:hypothetical protein
MFDLEVHLRHDICSERDAGAPRLLGSARKTMGAVTLAAPGNAYRAAYGTGESDLRAKLDWDRLSFASGIRAFASALRFTRRRLGRRRIEVALGVDFGDDIVNLLLSLGHHFPRLLANLVGAANRRPEEWI